MSQTITLLASGTRGDVQPYIALGLGLRQAGYTVRVATHANFTAFVARHGLTVTLLADNPSDLFARPGGADAMRLSGNPLRNARASFRYWRDARPLFARLVSSAWQACQDSDCIISGLPTLWSAPLAAALGAPNVRCLLQPLTPTRAFPSPLLPWTFSLGGIYNRLTYRLVEQTIKLSWRGALNEWHRATFNQPAPDLPRAENTLTLYGFSSHIVPHPADWSAREIIAGYWFLSAPSDWQPAAELEQFLAEGAPPVFIGFGSLTLRQPRKTMTIIAAALAHTKTRAVIAVPHGFANAALPPNLFPVTDVPHAWLFPRLSAVIIHGGAGTVGAALRAGVPTLVLPLAVDQFFWGARIAALGAGPRPLSPDALTVNVFANALTQAVTDSKIKARAQVLARALALEDGVANAVTAIRAVI